MDKAKKTQNSDFSRVIRYFLDHEKPKDEPSKGAKKRTGKHTKKPSTKATKRG